MVQKIQFHGLFVVRSILYCTKLESTLGAFSWLSFGGRRSQIWFDTMQEDQLIENWQELKEAMNHQFGPTDYDDFDVD